MFKIISKTLMLTGFLFMSALGFSASEDNTLCPAYRTGDFSILGDMSPSERLQNETRIRTVRNTGLAISVFLGTRPFKTNSKLFAQNDR